jgi:hypothetical protein
MCWLRLHYFFGISMATTVPEKKNYKRVGREKKELTVEKQKKRSKQSGVFLFPVRVNRRLCTALP